MELHELLAQVNHSPDLPLLRRTDLGIDHNVPPPVAYVEPELAVVDGEARKPAVALIAAPAAVGKSMLARSLAAATLSPLWDLGRFRVGSNFFTGTMARAYGGEGYAQLESALLGGAVTLIIDAADEALVRAGLGNYEEALVDLASLIGSDNRPKVSVVILGRPETLELSAVVLSEQDVAWNLYEIAFFDEARSRRLISARYGALTEREVHGAGIDQFTDTVFDRINAALALEERTWDSPELRSFLGYAPVLDALARLAAVSGNPHAEAQRLREASTVQSVWRLLHDVITSICEREASKFESNFGGDEPSRAALAANSYAIGEQIRLLLSPHTDTAEVRVPTGTPHQWADELVVAVRQQLREHPFLRLAGGQQQDKNPLLRFTNVAFRDFVVAEAFRRPDHLAANAAAAYYADPGLNPSPLLIRLFVTHELAASIDAVALGALVDSASAVLSETRQVRLHISEYSPIDDALPDLDDALAEITLTVDVFEAGRALNSFDCSIHTDGTIRLTRTCRNVFITAPTMNVILGSGLRDFNFGAPGFIEARLLSSEADDVRVSGEGAVVLQAQSFQSLTLRVLVGREATLNLRMAEAPFPWHQYVVSAHADELSEDDLIAAGMELRGVLSWFLRPSLHGGHRYPVRAMDIIRRKQRVSERMFDYCVSVGLIVEEHGEYVVEADFDLSRAQTFDLNDEHLRAFLEGYVRSQRS